MPFSGLMASQRWTVLPVPSERGNITIVCLLDATNTATLSFLVFPRIDLLGNVDSEMTILGCAEASDCRICLSSASSCAWQFPSLLEKPFQRFSVKWVFDLSLSYSSRTVRSRCDNVCCWGFSHSRGRAG